MTLAFVGTMTTVRLDSPMLIWPLPVFKPSTLDAVIVGWLVFTFTHPNPMTGYQRPVLVAQPHSSATSAIKALSFTH